LGVTIETGNFGARVQYRLYSFFTFSFSLTTGLVYASTLDGVERSGVRFMDGNFTTGSICFTQRVSFALIWLFLLGEMERKQYTLIRALARMEPVWNGIFFRVEKWASLLSISG